MNVWVMFVMKNNTMKLKGWIAGISFSIIYITCNGIVRTPSTEISEYNLEKKVTHIEMNNRSTTKSSILQEPHHFEPKITYAYPGGKEIVNSQDEGEGSQDNKQLQWEVTSQRQSIHSSYMPLQQRTLKQSNVYGKNLNIGQETATNGTTKSKDYIERYNKKDEQSLLAVLMAQYEKAVRPVFNASDTVNVYMGITLQQIFEMDERNEMLITNLWLDHDWTDVSLKWEPRDYGGLRTLRLPCRLVWLPDIVLYNNAGEYTEGLMSANVMVKSDGSIFWGVPTKLKSACKVDVTYFPFDEQLCKLKFGSWAYDGNQVDLLMRNDKLDLNNYVSNGEWELVNITIHRNVIYYACCPDEPFPDITFVIHIRRRTVFYLYNVICPCAMMSVLTLLTFCLPPDSGEKITMGITVLLAFSVFLLRMGEELPETSEFIPLISLYLTAVMLLAAVSVITTVLVLNLHFRGPFLKPLPKCLASCLKPRQSIHEDKTKYTCNNEPLYGYCSCSDSEHSLKKAIKTITEDLLGSFVEVGKTRQLHTRNNATKNISNNCNKNGMLLLQTGPTEETLRTQALLLSLRQIIERNEKQEHEEALRHDWHMLASFVDRVLFCIFTIITVAITVIFLVITPSLKLLS